MNLVERKSSIVSPNLNDTVNPFRGFLDIPTECHLITNYFEIQIHCFFTAFAKFLQDVSILSATSYTFGYIRLPFIKKSREDCFFRQNLYTKV
jgi:hypothetical protein